MKQYAIQNKIVYSISHIFLKVKVFTFLKSKVLKSEFRELLPAKIENRNIYIFY